MTFRINETAEFPFERTDRKVWYAIVEYTITGFHETEYTSSGTGKSDFIEKIKEFRLKKVRKSDYRLYGIWAGEWKADIFLLDETIVLRKLK
ncbi:MAG: hypothetical protein M0Q91_17000 [Methanoregula sp.]|nr:hypothetical protein [Methanoregula sp.]